MRIVRLTGDDWHWERELRLSALRDAPSAFGSTLEMALGMTEADWRYRIASQHRLLAVTDDDMALGMAGWLYDARTPAPVALLVGMWVAPDARGTGAGDALVRAVIADCVAAGESLLYLQVGTDNAPARRLYTRNGFAPAPPEDDQPPPAGEMTMWRRTRDGDNHPGGQSAYHG